MKKAPMVITIIFLLFVCGFIFSLTTMGLTLHHFALPELFFVLGFLGVLIGACFGVRKLIDLLKPRMMKIK